MLLVNLHAGMTAKESFHGHLIADPFRLLVGNRQNASASHSAGTAYGKNPFQLGVNIDKAFSRKTAHIHGIGSQKPRLLIGGEHALQPGVRQGIVVQNGKGHSNGNPVVSSQCRSVGRKQIPLHLQIQSVLFKINGIPRLLFTYHVKMALENHGGGIFVPFGGFFYNYYIPSLVLPRCQAVLLSKPHTVIADSLCIAGAVGNGA